MGSKQTLVNAEIDKGDMGSGDVAPDVVMRLLRVQAKLYDKLESYAARQRRLVAQEDTAPLLSLLADRQKLSTELQRLAAQLEPVRRNWIAFRSRMSPTQRDEAEELLAAMSGRLERLLQGDEEDARVLSARKNSIRSSLQATHAIGQALSAYRGGLRGDSANRLDEAL